jgi:HEAT repeat protein
MEDPRIDSALRSLLSSVYPWVIGAAAAILIKRGQLATEELAEVVSSELKLGAVMFALRGADQAIAGIMRPLLGDPRPIIRQGAAQFLIGQEDSDNDAFVALLQDEDLTVRLGVGTSLARLGEPRAFEVVASLLQEAGPLRLRAARSLHELGDARGTEALRSLLRAEDGETSVNAALGLATQGDGVAEEVLAGALEDSRLPRRMRLLAAMRLAERKDPRAVRPLVEQLRQERSRPLHSTSEEELLSEWRDPYITDVVLEALDRDPPQHPPALMRILAAQGGQRAIERLQELVEDERFETRIAATLALLGRPGDEVRAIVSTNLTRILEDLEDHDHEGETSLAAADRVALANALYEFIEKYMVPAA